VFKGKTPPDEKAQHMQYYVSILKKAATPPLDVRWGYETTSIHFDVGIIKIGNSGGHYGIP